MQAEIGRGDVDKTDDGSTNMAENTGATSPLGNKSGAIRKPSNVELVSYRGDIIKSVSLLQSLNA